MFTSFDRNIDSKELYFCLSSSLQIVNMGTNGSSLRFAGLYAIYKGDICYYVGQSQNLASRICQHVTGKYESADKVVVFLAKDNGFSDFDERAKETRKNILENNERLLIKALKPIENLLLPDQEFELPEKQCFDMFLQIEEDESFFYTYPSSVVHLDKYYISVSCGQEPDLSDLKCLSHTIEMAVNDLKVKGEL